MVGSFSFAFNRLLVTGAGSLGEIDKYIPVPRGKLSLICAPSFLNSSRSEEYVKLLVEKGYEVTTSTVHGEPDPDTINRISGELAGFKPDSIVAVGGGSVLDAGKAVSAMVPINGRVEEFLEGVGTRKPGGEKVPFIAVPTTSGTGSEATMNGVVSKPGPSGFKKSLRHSNYIPNAAVLDPELIVSCPGPVTSACGMDAFSQLLESFVSTKANPLSDALAWDGLTRFLSFFDRLMEDLENPDLRSEIALASYYSGLNLANVGLGIVHGLAGPVGGFTSVPHGVACGTLLYDGFRMTVGKINEELCGGGGSDEVQTAFSKLGCLGSFIGGGEVPVEEGVDILLEKLNDWTEKYKIARLSDFGINREDLERIADTASNKNNPVPFSRDEMIELLECRL